LAINRAFARRHGYAFFVLGGEDEDEGKKRRKRRNQAEIMLDFMKKKKKKKDGDGDGDGDGDMDDTRYDYVFYIAPTAIITNFDITLEELIQRHLEQPIPSSSSSSSSSPSSSPSPSSSAAAASIQKFNIAVCKDARGRVNTDTVLLRSNVWVLRFLQQW
jgi:hypothetical protein